MEPFLFLYSASKTNKVFENQVCVTVEYYRSQVQVHGFVNLKACR